MSGLPNVVDTVVSESKEERRFPSYVPNNSFNLSFLSPDRNAAETATAQVTAPATTNLGEAQLRPPTGYNYAEQHYPEETEEPVAFSSYSAGNSSTSNSSAGNSAAAPRSPYNVVEVYDPKQYAAEEAAKAAKAKLVPAVKAPLPKRMLQIRNLNVIDQKTNEAHWQEFTRSPTEIKVIVVSLFFKIPINYGKRQFTIPKTIKGKVEIIPGGSTRFDSTDDPEVHKFFVSTVKRVLADRTITHICIYLNADIPPSVEAFKELDDMGNTLLDDISNKLRDNGIIPDEKSSGGARRKSRKSRKSRSGRKTKSRKSHRRR